MNQADLSDMRDRIRLECLGTVDEAISEEMSPEKWDEKLAAELVGRVTQDPVGLIHFGLLTERWWNDAIVTTAWHKERRKSPEHHMCLLDLIEHLRKESVYTLLEGLHRPHGYCDIPTEVAFELVGRPRYSAYILEDAERVLSLRPDKGALVNYPGGFRCRVDMQAYTPVWIARHGRTGLPLTMKLWEELASVPQTEERADHPVFGQFLPPAW